VISKRKGERGKKVGFAARGEGGSLRSERENEKKKKGKLTKVNKGLAQVILQKNKPGTKQKKWSVGKRPEDKVGKRGTCEAYKLQLREVRLSINGEGASVSERRVGKIAKKKKGDTRVGQGNPYPDVSATRKDFLHH